MTRQWLVSLILMVLVGAPRADAKELFTFEGAVNLRTGEFNVTLDMPEESIIKASGAKSLGSEDYRITFNVDHFQSPFFDLSSHIESSLEFKDTPDGKIPGVLGRISSQYSLLDYKPTKEMAGHFEIKQGRLYFNSLSFADIACDGYVNLSPPFAMDMSFKLDGIPMENFLDFWAKGTTYDSSGFVSGEIKLSGTPRNLIMRGNLSADDGHLGKLRYDRIHLLAEGVYPLIHVKDTLVSKSDGFSFMVAGPVDISDKPNFKKQVKALKASPVVSGNTERAEWTIKKIDHLDLGSTEFKYLLRKDILGNKNEEESAMLGVEQKLEF
jgi:hypothetical protein